MAGLLELMTALSVAEELRGTFRRHSGTMYGEQLLAENVKAYDIYDEGLRLAPGASNRVPEHDAEWLEYIDSEGGWYELWEYVNEWTKDLRCRLDLKLYYAGKQGGWLVFPELPVDTVDYKLNEAREIVAQEDPDPDFVADTLEMILDLLGDLRRAREAADTVKSWGTREAIAEQFEIMREYWEDVYDSD